MSLTRRPYGRERLDGLVAFAEANPPSAVHALPARRLLEELSPPAGVFDLERGGRRVFVGTVVDRCENLHDAALLEVLGWNRAVPLERILAVVTPAALAVGRAAGRTHLSLSLPVGLAGDLGPAGWSPEEGSFVMERDLAAWEPPALPPEAAWEDLAVRGVAEHYAVVRAAFAEDPSMMLPDLETFAAASLGGAVPVRVLRVAGEEVAFARVTVDGRIGYVASIGRAPAWRGRRLGPIALAEALRLLAARKVARYRLGVTATNTDALALYRRWGFREVEAWRTWRRPLDRAMSET